MKWSPQRNVAQPSFRRKWNADCVLTRPSVTSATEMKRSGHGSLFAQIWPPCFYHQMKVIGPEVRLMHVPAGLAAGFAQRAEKPPPVLVIPEIRLAPVAAIHHTIDHPGILHSELPRHAPQIAPQRCHMSISRADPFIVYVY